ncbi:TadE/TadG family type IV pilus assembly protein [Amycolatopsis pigmentata]|uniref:TadE/TadG family type IV pilus assembly protein n=1 Tax=Amycolatopsis pigmentata TaxID=450801 RepID=UPI00366AF76F
MAANSNPVRTAATPSSGVPGHPLRWERCLRWWATWWRADRGSVATEVTLVAPFLVMLLVFVAVVIHRGVDARLRVEDAAHQAARAASIERTPVTATGAARSAAASALSAAGLTCASLSVDTATDGMHSGGTVAVTLSCTVDISQALILGGISQKRLSANAIEPIDRWRGLSGGGS